MIISTELAHTISDNITVDQAAVINCWSVCEVDVAVRFDPESQVFIALIII